MAASDASAQPLPDEARHLIVVDDDSRIRQLISRFLGENGYRVTSAESAAEARKKLTGFDFDLMILDVMMPGESGVELAKSLRGVGFETPILMLTARTEIDDRIKGLEAGVDDYLAKPFDPRELLLRINAILKRGATAPAATTVKAAEVRFGPYSFHVERSELKRGDEIIRLTDRERQLMRMFAERAGETIPRQDIVGSDTDFGDRTADVQMNRLRRKIERDPANPLYLQTVRGVGYRLLVD
jgi:two-component system phosphate regulon response regulator OmpR